MDASIYLHSQFLYSLNIDLAHYSQTHKLQAPLDTYMYSASVSVPQSHRLYM